MKDFLAFDLETQRSAQEVGGWNNIVEMRMSVGVLWDSAADEFIVYYEDDIDAMIQRLLSGPLVIGYNHMSFDYTVLSGYADGMSGRARLLADLRNADNLDLLTDLKDRIGKRVKLDSVARPTLNLGKSADGLMALQWYKEYLDGDTQKLQKIADYCQQDVAVTRDVYLHGVEQGQVFYEDKVEGIKKVVVDWNTDSDDPPPEESVQLSF